MLNEVLILSGVQVHATESKVFCSKEEVGRPEMELLQAKSGRRDRSVGSDQRWMGGGGVWEVGRGAGGGKPSMLVMLYVCAKEVYLV